MGEVVRRHEQCDPREPVTNDTAFSVASNGKAITAWLAMKQIDLHRPVLQQAPVKLPHTPKHRRITPVHLLTHTSGLGNFLRDRERKLHFSPGERFGYSGVGFMVLQELLEHRTHRGLDDLASTQLFQPAGMTHSWFGTRPATVTSVARPHIPLLRALAPFTLVAAPVFLVLCLILLIARRLRRRLVIAAAIASAIATFLFLWSRAGAWDLALWFSLVPALLFTLIAAVAFSRLRWAALVLVLAVVLAAPLPIPLIARTTVRANAASSLHASAPDLARFLILLGTSAPAEMTRAHRNIDAVSAWGLGIGVERHASGRDLWHWGSNPGAKSIMIICPETGDGVVVVTNGAGGSDPMRTIAERVLERKGCWRPGCAT